MNSFEQFEAPQVGFCPAGIFDHSMQGAGAKGLAGAVKEHGYRPAIRMTIRPMAAFLAHEGEAILQQSIDKLAGRDGAR